MNGIVRKVDSFGRIILPSEVRRKIGIMENTPVEMIVGEDRVIIQKHVPEMDIVESIDLLERHLSAISDWLEPQKALDIQKHIDDIRSLLREEEKQQEQEN